MTLRAEPLRPLFTANVTTDTHAITAGLSATLPTGLIAMGAYRGLHRLEYYGTRTSADNETAEAKIFLVEQIQSQRAWGREVSDVLSLCRNTLIATHTITLGTTTGIEGGLILDTEYFADTIAQTLEDEYDFYSALMGVPMQIFSPADNAVARWGWPDISNALGIAVSLKVTTAASINALYARGT